MKSSLRKFHMLAVFLLSLVFLFSCGEQDPIGPEDPDDNQIPVKSVKLDVTTVEMAPGEMLQLSATLLPEKGENTVKLLELYDELFSSVKLIKLSCKPDIEAAKVAYAAAQD